MATNYIFLLLYHSASNDGQLKPSLLWSYCLCSQRGCRMNLQWWWAQKGKQRESDQDCLLILSLELWVWCPSVKLTGLSEKKQQTKPKRFDAYVAWISSSPVSTQICVLKGSIQELWNLLIWRGLRRRWLNLHPGMSLKEADMWCWGTWFIPTLVWIR